MARLNAEIWLRLLFSLQDMSLKIDTKDQAKYCNQFGSMPKYCPELNLANGLRGHFCNIETLQELSSATLNCQVTKIVMNSGSQLS